jgi:hypothetical protein
MVAKTKRTLLSERALKRRNVSAPHTYPRSINTDNKKS